MSDGKAALIHKSSVNNITKDPSFPSPYFVFDEKVSVQHLSVTPLEMFPGVMVGGGLIKATPTYVL